MFRNIDINQYMNRNSVLFSLSSVVFVNFLSGLFKVLCSINKYVEYNFVTSDEFIIT